MPYKKVESYVDDLVLKFKKRTDYV